MNFKRITNKKILFVVMSIFIITTIIVIRVRVLNNDISDLEEYSIYTIREAEPIMFDGIVKAIPRLI